MKATESGGPRGFDAGKLVKGRKRHVVTDILGLMVGAAVYPADLQDHGGAAMVLRSIRTGWPWPRHVFADGGCAGPKSCAALKGTGDLRTEITKCKGAARGFEVLPHWWVVERTFAWLGRSRRIAKDWEASAASFEAWLVIAHIRFPIRRLARFHTRRSGL